MRLQAQQQPPKLPSEAPGHGVINMSSPSHGHGSMWKHYKKLVRFCGPHLVPTKCTRSMAGVAVGVFAFISRRHGENFSARELLHFKRRFIRAFNENSRLLVVMQQLVQQYDKWKLLAYRTFTLAKPVVTRRLVEEVNQKRLGWVAHYKDAMAETSALQAAQMTGLVLSEEETAEALEEARRAEAEGLLELDRSPEPLGPFDGRTHWPECSGISRHVRFQDCQNCWSHASALIAESRVCIASQGRLRGSDAWLSQSYIAMCRGDAKDYCEGASGAQGFFTINRWGLPTGGPSASGSAPPGIRTCVPQLAPNLQGVRCPAACTEHGYPRSLEEDLFFPRFSPRSLSPRGSQTLYLAKLSMLQEGPVLFGISVYADFWSYHSGIYRPVQSASNRNMGGHAVTGMGFGPGYFLCINSWGPTFGDHGAFMLAPEAINLVVVLPGRVSDDRFPTPVP